MTELYTFTHKPSRTEIFDIWNYSKGEIPSKWSFQKHGHVIRVYSGWCLQAW